MTARARRPAARRRGALLIAIGGARRRGRRRLRREAGEHQTARRSRSTVALDFYVNPDHAGIFDGARPGLLRRGRARRRAPPCPPIPRRRSARSPPGASTSRSPTSPRSCSPTTRGCRSTRSPRSSTAPLTSMIWLPELGHPQRRGPARQDDRHRRASRTRPPSSTRSSRRAGLSPDDVDQVDVGLRTCCRRCSRAAPTRCSAASCNIEGVDLAERGATRASSRSTGSGSRPTTSSSWSPTPTGSPTTPSRSALFIAALERGTRAAAADPAAATQAILDAGNGLDPKLTGAEVEATLPLLSRGEPRSPTATWTRASGNASPASSPIAA